MREPSQRPSHLRIPLVESLEQRNLLAADAGVGPSVLAMDTNLDGAIAPIDVLMIINELNRSATGDAESAGTPAQARLRTSLDVNGDGQVSPGDALSVINRLNRHGAGRIELEHIWGERASALNGGQREHLETLLRDVQAIRAKADLSPREVQQLIDDVMSLLDGRIAEAEQSVLDFVDDVEQRSKNGLGLYDALALSDGLESIADDVDDAISRVDAVVEDIRRILQANGVTTDDVRRIAEDLEAIFEQLHGSLDEDQQAALSRFVRSLSDAENSPDLSELLDEIRGELHDILGGIDLQSVAQLVNQTRDAFADGVSDDEITNLATQIQSVLGTRVQVAWEPLIRDVLGLLDLFGIPLADVRRVVTDIFAGLNSEP